jgi:hypothetical protein
MICGEAYTLDDFILNTRLVAVHPHLFKLLGSSLITELGQKLILHRLYISIFPVAFDE